MIQVGIKIMPHTPRGYMEEIQGYADYFEIYADPNIDLNNKRLSGLNIPVSVVHIAHLGSGVNFADNVREKINLLALGKALKIADYFGSEKIVFHPESIEDISCSVDNLVEFINSNKDYRLMIENMPFSTEGSEHLCGSFEEINEVIFKTGAGFCLDFTHASEYAVRTGIDLDNFLRKLLKLNPKHFHLADTDLGLVFDENYNETHLNLGEGNMDIQTIKKLIPDNSEVTLETPQNMEKQIQEIKDWH